MKRLSVIILMLLLCAIPCRSAAQKESNMWYFGYNAGIDFNSGSPVGLALSKIETSEGCASICNYKGELLFYTDGNKVWDRNHSIMPNGTNLKGSYTSTQSAIIVPMPGSATLYYIFTVSFQGMPDGFCFSIVDMTLNNGLGDVGPIKNINLLTSVCEKVTAVMHSDGHSYWIITHLYGNDEFHAYHLEAQGIDPIPVVSKCGPAIVPTGNYSSGETTIGYMRASPDGKRIAMTTTFETSTTTVLDFDASTGIVSNPVSIPHAYWGCTPHPYGLEFSPSGRFLYIGWALTCCHVLQYDLNSSASPYSSQVIGSSSKNFGALQLAPDGKIYCALYNQTYLSVIAQPDSLGQQCGFTEQGFHLQHGSSGFGLPTMIRKVRPMPVIFADVECFSSSVTFSAFLPPRDSLRWDFGDPVTGKFNTDTHTVATHVFSEPGDYLIMLLVWYNGIADTARSEIRIMRGFTLGPDTQLCPMQSLELEIEYPGAIWIWDDGSTGNTRTVNMPGEYWIKIAIDDCIMIDTLKVTEKACESVIEMPNVFTPNGDGSNDCFIPRELYGITDPRMEIFNRWGVLISITSDFESGWDGKHNTKDADTGTYFWTISYNDFESVRRVTSGVVSLLR